MTTDMVQMNTRISRSLKERGDAALQRAGYSPSQAVRKLMFVSTRREVCWLGIEAPFPKALEQGVVAHLFVRCVHRPVGRLDSVPLVRIGDDVRTPDRDFPPPRALLFSFAFLRLVFCVEQVLYGARVVRVLRGVVPQLANLSLIHI